MTAWAFCEDCSWTTTAGSVDVAGDSGRHAGMKVQHRVRVAQDDECGDLTGFGMPNGLGDQCEAGSGSVPQNGETA